MGTRSSDKKRKVSVNFLSSEALDKSAITVTTNTEHPNLIDVNIGFLKVNHKYAINFTIPNSFGAVGSLNMSDPSVGIAVKDVHFRDDDIVVSLEYTCLYKEGVITENFSLSSDKDPTSKMKVILHMEVLRKDQGTPSLKTGIHSIERLSNYESDQSDWRGF